MKKLNKIIIIITIVITVSVFFKSKVSAAEGNWDYLPLGENYLDPSNFTVEGELPDLNYSSINPFKINPSTTYSMFSSSYEQVFFASYDFTFYDINKTVINPTVSYQELKDVYVYGVVFDSPTQAEYISISFDIYLDGQVELYNVDDHFAFYEGDTYPDPLYNSIPYEGPSSNYIPVIEGESGYYYTDVDNPITVEEIKLGLVAVDDVDGDITENIIIYEDNYTLYKNTIGEHSVTFSVSDSSGNTSYFTVYVIVVDYTAPVITGNSYFVVSPTELNLVDRFKDDLSALDNYDGDLTSSIVLVQDDYSVNYNILGVYVVTFSVQDSSENSTIHSVTISVEDNINPIINGPSLKTKANNEELSLQTILTEFTASDDFDGDITNLITVDEDNYSSNSNQVGSWTITLSVTDSAGNITTKIITIEVIDKTKPVFLIDKRIITIDLRENQIEVADMIGVLQKTNAINEGSIVKVIVDEYTENKNTPGVYKIVLEAEEEQLELEVRVVEGVYEDIQEEETIILEKLSFFEKIGAFFENVWRSIMSFFTLLVNIIK